MLEAKGLTKVFPNGTKALDDVSFDVAPGRVLTLLGPSGCGKSTILRIVAGLEEATSGSVRLDGEPLDGLSPGARDVGFVFQNYALYPHLSVARNFSLALEARRLPRDEIASRVAETARLLGLEKLLDRRPGQLSGGQQQRVALGRALARRPRVYLMDEPLSNLDALLREEMRRELKALFDRVGKTVLYVTHDQSEAMSLSDEVIVLVAGRVRQAAPPLDLYESPADLFVATFVGSPRMTTWRGTVEGGVFAGRGVRLPLPAGLPEERELVAGFRPEDAEVFASRGDAGDGALEGKVVAAEPAGDRVLLTIRTGEETLRALAPRREHGEDVFVRPKPERIHWFSAVTERRLVPTIR